MKCYEKYNLSTIMEGLSVNQIGAAHIFDLDNWPAGVVSKTDLILAYRRGVMSDVCGEEIMSSPAKYIDQLCYLPIVKKFHQTFPYDPTQASS